MTRPRPCCRYRDANGLPLGRYRSTRPRPTALRNLSYSKIGPGPIPVRSAVVHSGRNEARFVVAYLSGTLGSGFPGPDGRLTRRSRCGTTRYSSPQLLHSRQPLRQRRALHMSTSSSISARHPFDTNRSLRRGKDTCGRPAIGTTRTTGISGAKDTGSATGLTSIGPGTAGMSTTATGASNTAIGITIARMLRHVPGPACAHQLLDETRISTTSAELAIGGDARPVDRCASPRAWLADAWRMKGLDLLS